MPVRQRVWHAEEVFVRVLYEEAMLRDKFRGFQVRAKIPAGNKARKDIDSNLARHPVLDKDVFVFSNRSSHDEAVVPINKWDSRPVLTRKPAVVSWNFERE